MYSTSTHAQEQINLVTIARSKCRVPLVTVLLVNCLLFCSHHVWAQISVSATAGVSGPTSYTNLRLAFAAVNDGTHQGAITVDITSSPSADNNTAVLNASGSGSASYTSVLVQPEGSTGSRSITGTVSGGPLVDLNGADNVTIDGRVGDGYDLAISNQSTASSAGTSTIRFINDASGNTLRDLTILGRSTGSVATSCGNVLFSTGSSTGNDDNTIVECIIANDGNSTTDLMTQAIVSVGSTSSLAVHNSGNVVDSCRIFNFHGVSGARGIRLGNGNHAWRIANNRFYQEAPRTDASGSTRFHAIEVATTHADAGGHAIEDNAIGGASATGTGIWELSGGANKWRAIQLSAAATAPLSTIAGNQITGFVQHTTAGGGGADPPSVMIDVPSGPVDIAGNRIGNQSDTGVVALHTTGSNAQFIGILTSNLDRRIRHNEIGGMALHADASLFGIRDRNLGYMICDSNKVGGTVAGSMYGFAGDITGITATADTVLLRDNVVRNLGTGTASTRFARGVVLESGFVHLERNTFEHMQGQYCEGLYALGGTVTTTNNRVAHLQGMSSSTSHVIGFRFEGTHAVMLHNTVEDLVNLVNGLPNVALGIRVGTGSLIAEGNQITGLTAPAARGLHLFRSPGTLTGNTIAGLLGNDPAGSHEMYGILAQDSACTATGNLITGLHNTSTGLMRGFVVTNAPLTAIGNTVADLSSRNSAIDGTVGIRVADASGTRPTLLRGNIVHTLRGRHATNVARLRGISLHLPDQANVVEANMVRAAWAESSDASSYVTGIHLREGTVTLRNNMVHLGLDSAGASVAANHALYGILVQDGTHAILHNSVYIGGTVTTSGSNHTYALLSLPTGTRDHRNNILWNARSNGAGSAKHYAVGVNASLSGLVSDHNCLYVSGTGGVLGREGTTDRSTLGAWQSATSLDGNSISVDPGFVNATGPVDDVDLHIQHNSAGAAALFRTGATGTGVLYDYDGAQRHSPPDMGADQILLVLPDFFEEPDKPTYSYWRNKGQVTDTDRNPRPDVKFYTDGGLPRTYLRGASTITFTRSIVDTILATPDTTWRVDLRFTGGKERMVDPQPVDMRPSSRNYYSPWCGPNGVTEVRGFGRAVYEDLYPFTDLHFYSGSGGPKLAFVIRPGGDMENIQVEFEGQDSLNVDGNGVLHAYVAGWDFPLVGGIAYQVDGGTIIPIGLTTYLNDVGSPLVDFGMSLFSTPVDPELPLVLLVGHPPMAMGGGGGTANLTWSTTVGNDITDSFFGDYILGGDHLPDNDLIVTGCTSDPGFPLVPGQNLALQGIDVFVSRFDYAPGDPNSDAQVLWTSFVIGSGYDAPTAIKYAVNQEKIYVSGYTNSTSWSMMPFNNPNDGSFYQSTKKGLWDGFILRLDPTLGILERSTLYGGNGDEIITAIVPDAYGQIYFWGVTSSTTGTYASCNSPSSGLPLCNPGTGNYQQDNNAGGLDIFVARFNSSLQLGWGSFVGGTGNDRVIDADQTPNDNPALNRIAIVGSTTSTLPYGDSGDFQLNSSGMNGFVWLFNSLGENLWGTHLNGTTELQAVSFGSTMLRVMGLTDFSSSFSIEHSCEAESGSLSICDGDDDLDFRAHYIAEFDLQQLGMNWSTLLNGYSDPSAEISASRYTPWALFDANRLMDIQTNGNDDFMVMGLVAKMDIGLMSSFPTQPMAGMYHKPYDPGMGNDQTELFLALFSNEHERLWSTMFGSSFPHITTGDPGYLDWYYLDRGLDFGHNIVWVDGEVLYLVGSTGGLNFDRQCPYPFPGPSYCELTELPLYAFGESWDGMIARFDLQGIHVGVPEHPAHTGNALLIYPSPSDDMIYLDVKLDALNGSRVMVFDATGRIALEHPYFHGQAISVRALSPGAYTLTLYHPGTGRSATGRFIRL